MDREPQRIIRLVLTPAGPLDAKKVLLLFHRQVPMPLTDAKAFSEGLCSGRPVILDFPDGVKAEAFAFHCGPLNILVAAERQLPEAPEAVPGVLVAQKGGEVIYNLIDPWRQKFLGRCIAALKKAGLEAEGTADFALSLGEPRVRLALAPYWERGGRENEVDRVVQDARRILGR